MGSRREQFTGPVVVTGLGAITPLGGDVRSTWAAMLAGRSGTGRLAEEWAACLPVRIAARAAVEPPSADGPQPLPTPGRAAAFLLTALREAWADAGFTGRAGEQGTPPPGRVGVCVGTGIGDAVPPALSWLGGGGMAARAAALIGAGAGAHTLGTACAAASDAIAYGMTMIRLGRADVVAAGGAEAAIHPLSIAAFARMAALSRNNEEPWRACRPYDKSRDGFVMGEGGGVLILESAAHARARGARIHGTLAGAGHSADAYHIVAPEPAGRGLRQAMACALADARLSPADIVHVNAHATASRLGDLAESRALADALGPGGYCVSATKSMTGHLLGAAGAVEAVATVLSLRDRLAPPTINVEDPDDAIGLDIVRGEPRPLPAGPVAALSTSAGFGGHNAVLAFRA